MPDDQLKCTALVKRDDGRDNTGKYLFHHERCAMPAEEVEIGGLLTKAKAVLCPRHRTQADREAFVSGNGFPIGKIKKAEKEKGYQQQRLPGTGIV